MSKQTLLDPKLFLFGLYPEKHNYSQNQRTFIDPRLAVCQSMYCNFMEKSSQTKYDSMDKTDVIMPSFRKDILRIKN